MKRILFIFILVCILSACGQKGDLYLEKTHFSEQNTKDNLF